MALTSLSLTMAEIEFMKLGLFGETVGSVSKAPSPVNNSQANERAHDKPTRSCGAQECGPSGYSRESGMLPRCGSLYVNKYPS